MSGGVELLLLRHAKSRWDEPGVADHDRGLAPRGERASAAIGRLLCREALRPDLVLCSTATRARATWERVLAAAAFAPPPDLRLERAIFEARPQQLLTLVQAQADEVGRLLLVGHHPGLQQLALLLTAETQATAPAALQAKYPTGGLARLRIGAGGWSDLAPGGAELVAFYRPRDLD